MGLCHRWENLPVVCPWTEGSATSGLHPPFYLPCCFKLLLHSQEGWRLAIMHWWLGSKKQHSEVSTPLHPASLKRKAAVLAKLNLHSVYNLIQIQKGGEWKSSFVTPTGHYEYRVMPGQHRFFVPKVYELVIPGVPPPFFLDLHQWYLGVLLEPDQTSSPRRAGVGKAEGVPTVSHSIRLPSSSWAKTTATVS